MDSYKLELYWADIPTNKKRAITYPELMKHWSASERVVRLILQELSSFDNGDNYILIRSAKNRGFYKTDDIKEIESYKRECMSRGLSSLAPIKKINRIFSGNSEQYAFENNLRVVREEKGLKQSDVCKKLRKYDKAVDKSMLSKFENGVCLPTPYQLSVLADIYGVEPSELLHNDFIY